MGPSKDLSGETLPYQISDSFEIMHRSGERSDENATCTWSM